MTLSTDLSAAPYFDDYDDTKNYAKILFRPGVSVQARELNQLQTILQKQVERFGDAVYTRGTIINGCQFVFHDNLQYVKLKDSTVDATSVQVDQLKGLLLKSDSTGLTGYVIDAVDGFEASDPNLKTLYLRYTNSGSNGTTAAYTNNEVITATDANNSLVSLTINDGSSGLSNSDTLVITAAIGVANSTGGLLHSNGVALSTIFTNEVGNTITQATTGAKARVISANTTANTSLLVLKIKPLANNLANGLNSSAWSLSEGYTITGTNTAVTANVISIIGSGATGTIVTDGAGVMTGYSITAAGSGYYVEPNISVAAANNAGNTTNLSIVNLTAKNYYAKVKVAAVANSTGNGYGLSVTSGVIYQKGYFIRCDGQTVIVEKYNTSPDLKVAGFVTTESVANSNIDSTLLDNASGSYNYNAPGANRLKLSPVLTVLSKTAAEADPEFFGLVEWSAGNAFKKNQTSSYNAIGQEMARRTKEEAGDFVTDPFYAASLSDTAMANDATQFNLVIDPGTAYISGYRVESSANYIQAVSKGTNTLIVPNSALDIDYGNYIRVNELGGTFRFSFGDWVSLRDTAATYLTASAGTAIAAGSGTEIGQARMKSLVLETGDPGTPTAVYRLYLFDIKLNAGQNFRSVKGVFYNGANKGLADIVLDRDGTTGLSIAQLYSPNTGRGIYPTKLTAVKTLHSNVSSANLVYTVRTIDNTISMNVTSNSVVTLASGYFPYSGVLSDTQKQDLIIVPLANTSVAANAVGSVVTTSGQSNVTGTSTTFSSDYIIGDYVKIANSTVAEYKRITSITNNTLMTVSSVFTNSFAAANTVLYFPMNVPVPFATRSTRTAAVVSNTSLYVNLGVTLANAVTISLAYNKNITQNSNTVTKTAKRKLYTKIQANTHSANTVGPWCLGIPDIFRLRNVYWANTTSVSTTDTNITDEFYIDHNQNEEYLGLGYLIQKPTSNYAISGNAVLLVEFDAFTQSTNAAITIDSYPINDSRSLANADAFASASTINTIEIPELWDNAGRYYDLRDSIDFRLISANTANVANSAATATINPVEPTDSARFVTTTDKNFPAPQSDVFFDAEVYLGRVDRVVLNSNGDFKVVTGTPGANTIPTKPENSITVNILGIPAYPSIPATMTANLAIIADTKIANEKYSLLRLDKFRVKNIMSNFEFNAEQPKAYTMLEISKLDRRIETLEYYVSMTLAEKTLQNKIIPSSANSSINRFKFGYFVDDFSSTTFTDLVNPEYNATVIDGRLYPNQTKINLPFTGYANSIYVSNSTYISLPYTEYTLINQPLATESTAPEYPPKTTYIGRFTQKSPDKMVITNTTVNIQTPATKKKHRSWLQKTLGI